MEAATPTPTEDLTAEQALSRADSLFVDDAMEEAMDLYTAAEIALKESDHGSALHFRILSHRAATFLRLNRHDEALEDASKASSLVKQATSTAALRVGETELALQRQGVALLKLNRTIEALPILEEAQQLAILNKRSTEKLYPNWIQQCHAKVLKPEKKKTTTTTTSAPSPAAAAAPKPAPTASVASTASSSKASSMPKYQYYQSDTIMTVSILEPSCKEDDLDVTFQPEHLTVVLRKNGTPYTVIAGKLYSSINPDACKIKIRPEKVLLKLRKTTAYEWPELLAKKDKKSTVPPKAATEAVSKEQLMGKEDAAAAAEEKKPESSDDTTSGDAKSSSPTTTTTTTKIARPYASQTDWDAVERELKQEEEKEKPEGDAAMNKLFQQIYASADEDTRRAMIKSYQTSGGTVLSTNWGEVSEKDYEKERTAPKGMEWKTWEGDKIPMKDDD